ncbi:alpha/beta fold hydrolase [Winogradskyella thalassocola]|uniref:Pimeloyl-ACP methyl ester carboxylesterase n=1 Tax=Winogradskyella thalassocola TaxID=262004 RepID=A0A1G7WAR8_9FLAO|nr:alpha/beta hydrolase [Winogradskyella thalassocola]SDG68919.1 Pimeloyl-ACP methyl ester carboxylesterase [Winogradskyella thalassocola]
MLKRQVNDIELDYEDHGKGQVLLMLHGLGSTKKDWDAQVPFFSKTHRVITVDLRGHGESTKPKDAYGVKLMTEDVKQLLDQLNIKKATLVGFSMGGAIAFEMAAKHPEYLENLVIVNSGPDFNAMGQIGKDLLQNRTHFLETQGLEILSKEISFNMFPEDHQIDLRNAFETRCKNNDYNAYYKSFVTLMDWGLGDQLKDIKTPTLVIASDMDYTPVSFKQDYVNRMQNASLVVIKNSRHGVVLDQPDAFNLELQKFLEA